MFLKEKLSGWKSSDSWNMFVPSTYSVITGAPLTFTSPSSSCSWILPSSYIPPHGCRDNHRDSSWLYDKLTLALTGEAFLLMHTGTLTCRSTLFDREAQIQTHSDTNTHTHSTRPLCPAMSLHSPGGSLCTAMPQAIMLHDWFIFLSSVVIGWRLLSPWKCFSSKFLFCAMQLFLLGKK